MISEILNENNRRKSLLEGSFDPLTGAGAPGSRKEVTIAGIDPPRMFLPADMLSDPLVSELVEAGSVADWIRHHPSETGVSPEQYSQHITDRFERIRCSHDFTYWAARYAFIKKKGGGDDVLFRLNPPQRRLVGLFEEDRQAGMPIRIIMLKARQWGGSTCAQLYMAWMQLTRCRGLNSLIIAHQGAASDEIKDMFERLVRNYPVAMLHEPDEEWSESEKKLERVGKSGATMRVPQRNCKIKLGSAERPDSCRGGDYNLVHCSEVGIWKRTDGKMPEDIVRSACSGVLLKADTMIVYESTANGTGNFFHREYEAARRGESQFKPIFISWFEIPQYSLPIADPEKFAATLYANRTVTSDNGSREASGAYLWSLWESGATLEGINWYIQERRKYSDSAMMAAEYPSDDMEAFAMSGSPVFDRRKVEMLREHCRQPIAVGCLEGLRHSGPESLLSLSFHETETGQMKVWRFPEISRTEVITDRYLCVVDVGGRSVRSDWSVITVFDRWKMREGGVPEVVAQWRAHTDMDILAWKAAAIARWYDNALLVIESNTIETRDNDRVNEGNQTAFLLTQIRDAYPNLYARITPGEEIGGFTASRYGFHTNMSTKPMVISTLVRVVREGLYIERATEAIEEMLTYERKPNGSFGAVAGCHDDMLMTRAIGLHICYHEMDVPRRELRTPSSFRTARHNSPLTAATI